MKVTFWGKYHYLFKGLLDVILSQAAGGLATIFLSNLFTVKTSVLYLNKEFLLRYKTEVITVIFTVNTLSFYVKMQYFEKSDTKQRAR